MVGDLELLNKVGANRALGPIRFRKLGGKVLVTNDFGRWVRLSEADFERLITGEIRPDDPLHRDLEQKLILRSPEFLKRAVAVDRSRKDFLSTGPNLHIIIVTLRCNYTCIYCHASRVPMDQPAYDMTPATAHLVVDKIFESNSPSINIEFQGGEPLANWPVARDIIEYALQKNRTEGRNLAFTLVSNLSLMDEEKLAFLIDNNIYVCTSVDGPRDLHEKNRIYTGGKSSSYDETVRWMTRFNEEYAKRGYDSDVFHVDALMTATRFSLPLWKEIVDEYVKLGQKSIHFRPLNPFGFVAKTWETIGYGPEDYFEFYRQGLEYVLELNLKGTDIIERMAAIYLTRILTDRDPNYMELRSPCGAGIGQVAYNYDGEVYTCDEGRMMAQMGDDIFKMGRVDTHTHQELMEAPEVRSLLVASTQDSVPMCSDCTYMPYCGLCPIYNYAAQGDIFGSMPTNARCATALKTFDLLFDHLDSADDQKRKIFDRWITQKFRQLDACTPYGGGPGGDVRGPA